MTIADALKEFFFKLNGVKPDGTNIAEVIRVGAGSVSRNNESALATRIDQIDDEIATLNIDVGTLNDQAVKYENEDAKSFVLKSSTVDSVKEFRITVVDDGTLSGVEIVVEEPVGQ